MIIERFRATVKRGRRDEAIAMVKQVSGLRIGVVFAGDNDVLTFDQEYEDLAAYATALEARASSDSQANLAEMGWWDVTTGMVTEVMLVVE